MSDLDPPPPPRPEPVSGTTFDPSPRKGLGGVLGGLFLMSIPTVVILWRFGVFTLDDRRPKLLFTFLALFVGLMGAAFAGMGVVQMLRKRRVVVAADRVQVVERSGGADVVLAQVLFANVAEVAVVRRELGKQAHLTLADRRAEGTYDAANAVRPWLAMPRLDLPNGQGFDFVIDDHYQGRIEDVAQAIDDAVAAWRKTQPQPQKAQ
jgi:hypothetical protein